MTLICHLIWETMNFQLSPDHYSPQMDNFTNPLRSRLFLMQALAYEASDRTRTPLHTPKTWETCKEKHVLFD